jgi:diadenosine tetraphosphate (Ap4A) HIT family hydrolase
MTKYKSVTNIGECIFCKIISGEIKTPGIFWNDEKFMAFLSTWPNMEGVTVLVPKKHYGSDVLKMPDGILQKMILAAKTVSNKLINHFNDVGRVGLVMEGTGVDHAHIKLYPMHGTDHMKQGKWKQYNSHNEKYFETYEGYISSNDGPEADHKKLTELAEKLRSI